MLKHGVFKQQHRTLPQDTSAIIVGDAVPLRVHHVDGAEEGAVNIASRTDEQRVRAARAAEDVIHHLTVALCHAQLGCRTLARIVQHDARSVGTGQRLFAHRPRMAVGHDLDGLTRIEVAALPHLAEHLEQLPRSGVASPLCRPLFRGVTIVQPRARIRTCSSVRPAAACPASA